VLQCVAVCCSVSQCVAVCCNVSQCVAEKLAVVAVVVAECCRVLQIVAVCRSVSQCVAKTFVAVVLQSRSLSLLQRDAVFCSVMHEPLLLLQSRNSVAVAVVVAVYRNVSQCVAVCCRTYVAVVLQSQLLSLLQCVAVCCSVSQGVAEASVAVAVVVAVCCSVLQMCRRNFARSHAL